MSECLEVYNNIRFDPEKISSCSYNTQGPTVAISYDTNIFKQKVVNYKETLINYKKEQDLTYQSLLLNKIPSHCQNCVQYMQDNKTASDNKKIKIIDISHWRQCNANCIYCCFQDEKREMPQYNILTFLKLLKKDIDEKCWVKIGGGEPSILPEMGKLLNFFAEWKKSTIFIMSNFIIFRKEYLPLLKNGQLFVTVSLDCGDRELYKKIKQTDNFDTVIKNLKTCMDNVKHRFQLNLKYIIIEDINDTKADFDKFMDIVKSLNIEIVHVAFDRRTKNMGKNIPDKVLELYDYAKQTVISNNLNIDIDVRNEVMFQKKEYI